MRFTGRCCVVPCALAWLGLKKHVLNAFNIQSEGVFRQMGLANIQSEGVFRQMGLANIQSEGVFRQMGLANIP